MPEGFSSIADLKFVVDANVEKLNGNLQLAKNVVTRFTEESNERLGLFEGKLAGLGGSFSTLSAKANIWAAALTTVSNRMQQIRAQGEQVAAMGGKQTEWQELVGEYDKMIASVREGVPRAVRLAGGALLEYATSAATAQSANDGIVDGANAIGTASQKSSTAVALSADEITARLNELSQMTRKFSSVQVEAALEGVEGWDRFAVAHADKSEAIVADNYKAATGFHGLIEAMRNVTHEMNRLKGESGWSEETTERELERQAGIIKGRVENIHSGMALGDSMAAEWLGLGNTDAAFADVMEKFSDFYDRAGALRAAKQAAAAAEIEAEAAANHAAAEKPLAGVDKEIDALFAKANAFNMTKGEAAEYAMVQRVVAEMTARNAKLTEEDAEALGRKGAALRALVDQEEARAKAKSDADAADRYMKSLENEIRNLDQQSGMIGKTTTEIAANNAEMRFRNQLADQGIKLSGDQAAKADAEIARIRARTEANAVARKANSDESQQTRTFEQSILALQRQTIGFEAKTAALYDNSEAGRVNALVEQHSNDLKARGVPLTEARIAAIRREAAAQVDAAQANEQAQRQMEMLRSYVQTATGAMEGAFRKFTQSGKFDFRDMISSMLADMAQLTFKKGVTDTIMGALFGGGGKSGGGLLAGLFGGGGGDVGLGSWGATTTFAGARADGGPVNAGEMYLVGERGPEPFIPSTSGTILPNGFLQALSGAGQGGGAGRTGGDVHVYLHPSPEFDARIESTADGVVARRAPEIVSASMQANKSSLPSSVRDVQARNL